MSDKVKGEKNGLCNRTACQTPHKVTYYNEVMNKFYCLYCAREIQFYADMDGLVLFKDLEKTT